MKMNGTIEDIISYCWKAPTTPKNNEYRSEDSNYKHAYLNMANNHELYWLGYGIRL